MKKNNSIEQDVKDLGTIRIRLPEASSEKSFKKTYSEKFKDPRWQKKRLQIMERDEFTCQNCGDDKSTLNVHHLYYIPLHDPWEYKDITLVTLCETCHKRNHDEYDNTFDWIKSEAKAKGFTIDELTIIIGFINKFSENIIEYRKSRSKERQEHINSLPF